MTVASTCIGGFHSMLLHGATFGGQLHILLFVPCGSRQIFKIVYTCYQTYSQYLLYHEYLTRSDNYVSLWN